MTDDDYKYGASHSLFQMVSELLKMDCSMKVSVVLTKKSELAQAYSKLGCDVYQIPYRPFMTGMPKEKWKWMIRYPQRGLEYLFGRWYGIRVLEKKLDVNSVDIIHSNSSREDFGALLAQKYSKPLFWHIREYGDYDFQCYSYRKDNINLMNQVACQCIAISDAVRNHWIKKGILPEKIKRIYNGVDSTVSKKDTYGIAADQPVRFVMMGSIGETKGQLQVVEAAGLLHMHGKTGFSVDIIGSGNKKYLKEMETRITMLGLSSVICMKGYQRDFYQNLAKYDCGLMCSRSEGFGRVTAEYMMAGLPVIASNAGANPELIKSGENGFLHRLNDVEDLAEKMLEIMTDSELRERLGRKAAERAVIEFSSAKNAKQIYQLYCEVLNIHILGTEGNTP